MTTTTTTPELEKKERKKRIKLFPYIIAPAYINLYK